MKGFVRVFTLLPGLVLTAELLNRAGADWFGAYLASVLTICLSVALSKRYIIAPESALTAELVFSSVFIMGLGHGAAKVILLLGALLALPIGGLLSRCGGSFRRVLSSTSLLGLSLLLLSMGLSQGGLIKPAVMTHSQLGNLIAPEVLVTLLTLLVMGLLRAGASTSAYTLPGGLVFALLLAAGEGFLDFDYGLFAMPSGADIGKVWFAFDFPIAGDILLTSPGDIMLPALTIAVTMGTMAAAVCQTDSFVSGQMDCESQSNLNVRASLLGVTAACLGSGPVTLSPLSLLGRDADDNGEDGSRRGMLLAGILLLCAAPLARSIAECPGIIAPFFIWLGCRLTCSCLTSLSELIDGEAEGAVAVAAAVIAALSYNLTAGMGAALVSYTILQLLKGQGSRITGTEWLITGCYILYFSSYCF